ncbi:MAG: septum site-determining protein MinC [Dehalococcoidia bacterium]
MLETNPIQVMGRGTNVDFSIDDAVPIEVAAKKLEDYLKENRFWCSSGVITVNVGRRVLVPEEISEIKRVLDQNSGLRVARFWCAPSIMEEALSANMGFGVAFSPSGRPAATEAESDPIASAKPARRSRPDSPSVRSSVEMWREPDFAEPVDFSRASMADWSDSSAEIAEPSPGTGPVIHEDSRAGDWERLQHNRDVLEESESDTPLGGPWDEDKSAEDFLQSMYPKEATSGLNRGNEALLIKTTCRSGEVIRYAGDIVVFADVNPGAEIIADGDIVVFGSLRGLAHAGAGGDVQATITALKLETHRLQIGPYTGVASKPNQSSKSNRISPKIAYVRRRGVYVAPFAGRFAGYSGGTPYGG